MTDQENFRSLDEIMSREPETAPVPEPNNPAVPETGGQGTQPRDEVGKFAPKAEKADDTNGNADEAAQAAVEGGKPEPGHVPLQALQAEREKGKAARTEAEQLRQQNAELIAALTRGQPQPQPQPTEKPKAKNFWENPDDFLAEKLSPVQQSIEQQRIGLSTLMAVKDHGADTVKEAQTALGEALKANRNDPTLIALEQSSQTSIHPMEDLVAWYKRRQAMADIGEDPAAYRERVRQELLAEFQPATPAPTPPQQPAAKTPMPSNFAGARSEGPRTGVTYTGPKPLSEITKGSAQ